MTLALLVLISWAVRLWKARVKDILPMRLIVFVAVFFLLEVACAFISVNMGGEPSVIRCVSGIISISTSLFFIVLVGFIAMLYWNELSMARKIRLLIALLCIILPEIKIAFFVYRECMEVFSAL